MHSRVRTNQLKDDNKKLTTKLSIAEHEMNKKDKVIDDLLVQAEQIQGRRKGDIKVNSHLEINLKRKVRQL